MLETASSHWRTLTFSTSCFPTAKISSILTWESVLTSLSLTSNEVGAGPNWQRDAPLSCAPDSPPAGRHALMEDQVPGNFWNIVPHEALRPPSHAHTRHVHDTCAPSGRKANSASRDYYSTCAGVSTQKTRHSVRRRRRAHGTCMRPARRAQERLLRPGNVPSRAGSWLVCYIRVRPTGVLRVTCSHSIRDSEVY